MLEAHFSLFGADGKPEPRVERVWRQAADRGLAMARDRTVANDSAGGVLPLVALALGSSELEDSAMVKTTRGDVER
jgi:hypothetical protein